MTKNRISSDALIGSSLTLDFIEPVISRDSLFKISQTNPSL